MATSDSQADRIQDRETTRRSLFSRLSSAAMLLGLVGGYGAFARIALRFLYPAQADGRLWQFVARVDALVPGGSMQYRAPNGEPISITRQGQGSSAEDFIALSSTCPHLGCQVHWQAQHSRYFCPCHNGTFDASGVGTGGPPGDAGQSLPRFPLDVRGGLLFIEVPSETLVAKNGHAGPRRRA